MAKKTKTQYYNLELDGRSLRDAIDYLQNKIEGGVPEGAVLNTGADEGFYSDIYFSRPETDEEYEIRIASEAVYKKLMEQRELETYKKLKDKYENVNLDAYI